MVFGGAPQPNPHEMNVGRSSPQLRMQNSVPGQGEV